MEHCGKSFSSRWPFFYSQTDGYDALFCLSSNVGLFYHEELIGGDVEHLQTVGHLH